MKRIVVTGTDTGIGKTRFAAALTQAIDGLYWKPVQSGLEEETDSEAVNRLIGKGRALSEAWRLPAPIAPHRAAELAGVEIDALALVPPETDRPLVIEGAGGVLVPLNRMLLFADLFARWGFPTVLCARTSLGTISHSLLAIEALRLRGVPILGVAFIGDHVEDSEATIAEMGGVKRLGRLPWIEDMDGAKLAAAFAANFDVGDFG